MLKFITQNKCVAQRVFYSSAASLICSEVSGKYIPVVHFFSLGPFVLSLSVSVIYPRFFCIISETGECQCSERGHLKGKVKQAILCHGFTEPYYDFCGCISSHVNASEIQSQNVCVSWRWIYTMHFENVIGKVTFICSQGWKIH